jgi:hypothetical protein
VVRLRLRLLVVGLRRRRHHRRRARRLHGRGKAVVGLFNS